MSIKWDRWMALWAVSQHTLNICFGIPAAEPSANAIVVCESVSCCWMTWKHVILYVRVLHTYLLHTC
jgi:hypothetical protein